MRIACAALLLLVGCQESPPAATPAAQEPPGNPLVSKELRDWAKKQSDRSDADKTALAKQLEDLKDDPQPLFDMAETAVKEAVAETAGDDSANAAIITTDKASLKTFGPKKWTVRGTLRADNRAGQNRETTWEVTLEVIFDKIQVRTTQLEVR